MLPTALALLFALFLQAPAARSAQDAQAWLQEAWQQFQKQQWERSRQAALKALEMDPRLGDAEIMLGLVATAQNQFEEAEKRFRNATALQPANPRAHAYLGSTYLQLKRAGNAARAFQEVLRLDAGNLSATYNLGLISLLEGRPADALPRFERVHLAEPKDVPALIGVLECQLLLKRSQEAAASAGKLVSLVDVRDPRLLQAATMLAMHGEYASAIPILERIRQASPESRGASYNLALAYLRSSQPDRAAGALQPLLTGPRSAEAYNLLAEVESARKRPQEALAAYRRAAELEPGNEDYRFDYAAALVEMEGAATGATEFSAGVRDLPKSWRMHLGSGCAAYLEGRYEEAVRALLEAVRLEPSASEAYYLLGHAYESAQSLQPEVAKAFEAYLGRKSDDPWALYHYGTILYLRSQSEGQSTYERARVHLLKAVRLKPDFAEAYVQLGMIAEKDEEAVKHLERAIELSPGLASAHYRLGLALQRLGDRERAKQEMDLFRKLRAESEAAERARVLQSLSNQRK